MMHRQIEPGGSAESEIRGRSIKLLVIPHLLQCRNSAMEIEAQGDLRGISGSAQMRVQRPVS